ncbi:hypothetical protein G7Y89_g4363 [Cudoniella acicularis]|uniref:LysM domain-containing protein n=1 Tax=Cudoniella acicularis TaxID=354080 RepID=A0A8H4RRQ7_9HELO|nr:hypothetical protein G7Y89_g4363 [Cudoniella acicularis]
MGKCTVASGDTLSKIAESHKVSLDALEAANPGVTPEKLQVGQVLNLPSENQIPLHSNTGEIPGSQGGTNGGGNYINYSGPAANFPHPDTWAKYSVLWDTNSKLMKYHDSDEEIAMIKSAIEQVARESGCDVRAILCMIMQETGGNVRAGTTAVQVTNPGLMQSHNGVSFNPRDPRGSILQMVRDGTEGTATGDGLRQLVAKYGNYYEAFRGYNSGTVDKNQLNDGGVATPDYVRNIANRLMGHTWQNM